jgi:two-component system NtrC family response regulator
VDRVGGKASVPIDVRVIAATNKNLEAAIKERTFREDLYYRLKVIHIQTPSLRDVPEDIPVLGNHFLAKYCKMMNTELKQFTTRGLEELSSYSWPGNARQLENEIKRLVASVRGKSITEDHLDAHRNQRSIQASSPKRNRRRSRQRLDTRRRRTLERRLIEEALQNSVKQTTSGPDLGPEPPGFN